MKITSEFAELAGAFSGDGWISQSKKMKSLFITGNPKDEKQYYKRIAWLFKKSCSIKVKLRDFSYWKTYGVITGKQKVIGKFLSLGLKQGHKATSIDVPKAIKAKKEFLIPFIRGLFDTDGTIYFQKSYNKNASVWQKKFRHIPTIDFTFVSKNLIESLLTAFSELGFNFRRSSKPKVPKNGRNVSYRIRLKGKENTTRFFQIIAPKNPRHLKKFKKWQKQGFY